MDVVDRDLERAERDASPERFPSRKSDEYERIQTTVTASSSSSATSARSVTREEMNMSRINTQGISRINTERDLERHPTALSRIHTQRSQHVGTVGRSLKSRESRKPLPEFGAGKSYPPQLPDKEEYVVEFDGPDDPLHPQNWSMRKK